MSKFADIPSRKRMQIYLTSFLLISGFAFTQNNKLNLLESSGEMPGFLHSQQTDFYIPQPMEWVQGEYRFNTKDHHLQEIYKSGMIVYGDSISQYCTDLLEKLDYKKQVYSVKSRYPGVFSNTEGQLFITTGLFSQLTSEAELGFFLVREILATEGKARQILGVKNKAERTLENTLKKLTSYTNEVYLDSLGYDYMIKNGNYTAIELLGAFDVLLYANVPFYESKIDWNYFNSDQVFIPENELFFLYQKKNFDYYNPKREHPGLAGRKKNIERIFTPMANGEQAEHYLLSQDFFNKTVSLARRNDILNDLLYTHFHEALYEIYILEKTEGSGYYLDYMKAHAWLGILKQKKNLIRQSQYSEYDFSDNEGALFCRFIRSQPPESQVAFCLRNITDIYKKYPSVTTFGILYRETLKLAASTPEFNPAEFSKINYQAFLKESENKNTVNNPTLPDTKKNQFEQKKPPAFYRYIIADMISDPSFIKSLDSLRTLGNVKEPLQRDRIVIRNSSIHTYSNEKRGESFLDQENLDDIQKLSDVSLVKEFVKMDATEAYNKKSVINATIMQSYSQTAYKEVINPILAENLIDTKQEKIRSYCILQYENQFRPRIRAIHFTGLFVVPLPYVIPEFFYSGHRSMFASFYFNAQNGQMEAVSFSQFRDPGNRIAFKNVLYHSLNSNYKAL